jgi:hypothetical protein
MNTNVRWLPPPGGRWRMWIWIIQELQDFLNKLLGLVTANLFTFRYVIITCIGLLSLFMVGYPPYRVISAANHGTILISYHLFMMFIAGLLGFRMVYVSREL